MYDNGIRTFDDVTVYSFVVSRPAEAGRSSILDVYNKHGGYDVVKELVEECSKDKMNEEYHLSEIQKFESLRKFQQEGLVDTTNLDLVGKLAKMTLKQIQMYFQLKIKETFSHINCGEVVEYNLIDNLYETIDELDQGEEVGLPFHDSPRLNKKINGWKKGNLMYLVLSSGVGKSSFGTEKALLSLIEKGEKGIVFANEEGIKRWRARLLATVASRILRKPVSRDVISKGGFSDEIKQTLKEAADWLYQNRRDMIKFCLLKKYRIEDVISRIEMYRPRNFSFVFFDTFKPDLSQTGERWLAFANSAQELYDCIKEEANNCATLATVQMKIGKEYRYLDLEVIGKSLEIVETAAVVLAGRMIYSDEYPGGKNELKPYNWRYDDFAEKYYKDTYTLNPEKQYMILFIPKNREGGTDEQIVYEVNYKWNSWKEVAYVVVPRTSKF